MYIVSHPCTKFFFFVIVCDGATVRQLAEHDKELKTAVKNGIKAFEKYFNSILSKMNESCNLGIDLCRMVLNHAYPKLYVLFYYLFSSVFNNFQQYSIISFL